MLLCSFWHSTGCSVVFAEGSFVASISLFASAGLSTLTVKLARLNYQHGLVLPGQHPNTIDHIVVESLEALNDQIR